MNYYLIDCFNFTLAAGCVALKTRPDDFDNAIYDITASMLKRIKSSYPDGKWYSVWDSAGGTEFRKEIDENYKQGRPDRGVHLEDILALQDLFSLYGCQNVAFENTEADDVIAVLAKALRERDASANIVIISRDRDMLQVVQNGWANALYDFSQKSNVAVPEYSIVDLKALSGDRSDAIKGLPGVGPKTAEKILRGERALTPEERELFEKYKRMVDTRLHPLYEINCNKAKELINVEE